MIQVIEVNEVKVKDKKSVWSVRQAHILAFWRELSTFELRTSNVRRRPLFSHLPLTSSIISLLPLPHIISTLQIELLRRL